MRLSVLVPYRPDGGWRDRAWEWNQRRIRSTLPGAEVVVDGLDLAGDEPAHFAHPLAINAAARRASGDVLLIQDADTVADPAWVRTAVGMVADGRVPWMLPTVYRQLTRKATAYLVTLNPRLALPAIPSGRAWVEWEGAGVSWAGLVVVPREAFELAGGYDERFREWGGDDVAFGMSLDALWGQHERLIGYATHLWHPRDGLDGQPRAQHDLMYRYIAAGDDRDADAMRALIAERDVAHA